MLFLSANFNKEDKPMNKISRFIIWICKKFNRDEILIIITELLDVIENINPDLKPRDDFSQRDAFGKGKTP